VGDDGRDDGKSAARSSKSSSTVGWYDLCDEVSLSLSGVAAPVVVVSASVVDSTSGSESVAVVCSSLGVDVGSASI
jgi:hypothetical protein